MYQRFPNTFDNRYLEFFKLLHNDELHVRRQALLVTIHLILNDMIKLKGEIVDVCMLLSEPEEKIQNQVKLFLHELNLKDNNIIYNLFSKALNRLSRDFKKI
jgi:condensin complex subunit 1